MFSFTPSFDPRHVPQSSYSYGPARPRAYGHPGFYPSTYSRALDEERVAREAAARRAAAEREARTRPAQSYSWNDDDYDDGYGHHTYLYDISPRERAYADARRRDIMRARKVAAEEQKRKQAMMEERNHRERELRTAQSTGKTTAQTARSPSPPGASSASTSQSTPPHPHPESHSGKPSTEKIEAASKIQTFYRKRKALDTISQIESNFQDLKRGFIFPETIDFLSDDGSIISLRLDGSASTAISQAHPSTPNAPAGGARLAFTHTNIPIRTYDEALNRILTQLDAVQSWGEKKIRERRKDVVRAVEEEARRVEGIWEGVWNGRFGKAQADRQEIGVDVDEEEVSALLVGDTAAPPANGNAVEKEVEMTSLPAESGEPDTSEMSSAVRVIDEESIARAEDNVEMTTNELEASPSSLPLPNNHYTQQDEDAQMILDAPVHSTPAHVEPLISELELIPDTLHDGAKIADEATSALPSPSEPSSISLPVKDIQSVFELDSPSPLQQTPVIDYSEDVAAEPVIVTPEEVVPQSELGLEIPSDDIDDDDLDYVSFHSVDGDAGSDPEGETEKNEGLDERGVGADDVDFSDEESVEFVML